MPNLCIYHNPNCSKSRATLALLEDRGYTPKIIEYLKTPPDEAELEHILDLLGMQPLELVRRGEPEFNDLGLGEAGVSREQLLSAMVTHPRLIERPIVLANGCAALGRPPEAVLEIL